MQQEFHATKNNIQLTLKCLFLDCFYQQCVRCIWVIFSFCTLFCQQQLCLLIFRGIFLIKFLVKKSTDPKNWVKFKFCSPYQCRYFLFIIMLLLYTCFFLSFFGHVSTPPHFIFTENKFHAYCYRITTVQTFFWDLVF